MIKGKARPREGGERRGVILYEQKIVFLEVSASEKRVFQFCINRFCFCAWCKIRKISMCFVLGFIR